MLEHIERFLQVLAKEKGYASNTIVAYRNDLTQFHQFASETCQRSAWAEVAEHDLEHYLDCLREDHEYATATVARKVAAVKSFFHHLASEGILTQDPTKEMDSPHVRKYTPVSLTESEVKQLLRAPLQSNGARSLRDAALLELLYATGMRVSEIVSLDLDQIDLERGSVHCRARNRQKDRVLPFYPRAADALHAYLTDGRPSLVRDNDEDALFLNHRGQRLTRQGLWLIIKRYVKQTGIRTAVTPHTLRHSFARHMLNGGADVHEVQGLLGHANVSTTQVYTQAQVRAAYEEAHPRST
ncbi:MAG: site-specific tyrosine recombinase/integron integrase [Anaerolineae bacterium]|jgi:integrase/recombinase XerD